MEDKTPIYLLSIVGIVALVAVVYMLSVSSVPATTVSASNTITGNAVNEDIAPTLGVGRFIMGVVLVGAFIYMYRKWD